MNWTWIDAAVVAAYVVFALGVGVVFARRASRSVDEFFLTGRTLPWWVAGTSMVATTFAADTPLFVTGLVRDEGIWRNWLWWCFAVGGLLTVYLFARLWRRGGVMTTAEFAELRYGGRSAKVLRGFLGLFHAGITNTITLSWVLLAAAGIIDVLLEIDKATALVVACGIGLVYSLLAGLWGVVLTDMLQFVIAMVGATWLATLAWDAAGGTAGVLAAADAGDWRDSVLAFVPPPGEGTWTSATFWTAPLVAFAVNLGVSWWAKDGIDGGGVVVQRLAACRDERQGMLAALWFNVANYALRPWPWIAVALASLVLLPDIDVLAPAAGVVSAVGDGLVTLTPAGGGEAVTASWDTAGAWTPRTLVSVGDSVAAGDVVAATNSELAYPEMMVRLLPTGVLGLVVASLVAAFMSTIDTHVNLASSFFVNDVYRRFIARDRPPRHYVFVARLAGVGVLVLGGLLAYSSTSIKGLFTFFLAFLGGVGPVYAMRWLWWRVTAATEIATMIASSVTTVAITSWHEPWSPVRDVPWRLGALSPGGELTVEGRLVVVVVVSLVVAAVATLARRPDPAQLVRFYRRVRPLGWWGPVAALAPDVHVPRDGRSVVVGTLSSLAFVYASMLGVGFWLLDDTRGLAVSAVVAALSLPAAIGATRALARQTPA